MITGPLAVLEIPIFPPNISRNYALSIIRGLVYAEIYFFHCCLLEKYLGQGRYEDEYKQSWSTRILTWLWGLVVLVAGVMSTAGWGLQVLLNNRIFLTG